MRGNAARARASDRSPFCVTSEDDVNKMVQSAMLPRAWGASRGDSHLSFEDFNEDDCRSGSFNGSFT